MYKVSITDNQGLIICLAFALAFGVVTALVYAWKNRYSKSMFISLMVLPIAITAVLTLINGNLGGGVGVGIAIAGAFGLLRFRSVPGTAQDITYVFISLVAGVAASTGEIGYGAIAVGSTLVIMIAFKFIPLKKTKSNFRTVKITMPESLDYSDAFDDVFKKYASQCDLVKSKTTNMGSTFELTYELVLKNAAEEKVFLDELRIRNGNLPISCSSLSAKEELL